MDRLHQFFSDNFYAPHGFCLQWIPEIVWLHVISDLLIAVAYFSIPVALWYFARKRPDMPFRKLFFFFAVFITLCGLTHVLGIVVLWYPFYGVEGLVMLATGLASVCTSYILWRIMPQALTLPSPAELQKINEQLSVSKAQIEEMVQTRTAELSLAQAKAEAASAAKDDFLANMSHEIRTPMNVILGISSIVQNDETLKPQMRQYMKTLQTSAQSLMELLNDILDVSKIESGKLVLEQKNFSIYKIVEEMGNIFRFQAEERGLSFLSVIKCDCLKERVFVGDPNRLRQVLINLCSNAIKFTEQGGVTIEIWCGDMPESLAMKKIIFSVKDTGIGIPEDKLNLIFEKFVQADTSITRKYGGTGLGLTISKFLVDAMNGTIEVTSTLGKGTDFKVTLSLPLAETA